MSTNFLRRLIPTLGLLFSIAILMILTRSEPVHANAGVPANLCATVQSRVVNGIGGLFGAYWSGRGNSASWDNGNYHYQIFFSAVFGDGNAGYNGNPDANYDVNQETEINSWDCTGGGNPNNDTVDTSGNPNVGGGGTDWVVNGVGIHPTSIYLGSPGGWENGGSPVHDGIFLSYADTGTMATTAPPVYSQTFGSAAAAVDDGGRIFITNSSGGNVPILCAEFGETDQPYWNGYNLTCIPDIQTIFNAFLFDRPGAGFLQNGPDCLLSNPNTYLGGQDPFYPGNHPQCSDWRTTYWYNQYGIGDSGDQSGESATNLTPYIGRNADGTLQSFNLHMSAVNTVPGGFGTALFYTMEYPHDNSPPIITSGSGPNGGGNAASCGVHAVSFNATDPDSPGSPLPYAAYVNGVLVSSGSTTGSVSVYMGGYDQLKSETVQLNVASVTVNGTPGYQPSSWYTVTYGPCYQPVCSGLSFNIVAGGNKDINASYDGLTPGEKVTVSGGVNFVSLGGPSGQPSNWAGTLTIKFGATTYTVAAYPKYPLSGTTPQITLPAGGTVTYSIGFNDPGSVGLSGPCNGSQNIGSHPYFTVSGGDVVTGSGISPSCTQDNGAGIMAFNDGPTPTYDDLGAGGNLANLAPSIINGFASSNGIPSGINNPATSDALTFANTVNSPFGGNLGATAGCTVNYSLSGQTHHIYTSSLPFNINNPPAAACTPPGSPTGTEYCSVNVNSLTGGSCDLISSNCNHIDLCENSPLSSGATACDTTALPKPAFNGHLVVFVNGDVEIEDNIILNKTYASVAAIPSFDLIVNGDIYFDNDLDENETATAGLTELDGVYIAEPNSITGSRGNIYTCTLGHGQWSPTGITYTPVGSIGGNPPPANKQGLYSNCKNGTLLIDGAMIANQVRLNRTYGTVGSGQPAENITYDPNVWMNNPFSIGQPLPSTPTYLDTVVRAPVL